MLTVIMTMHAAPILTFINGAVELSMRVEPSIAISDDGSAESGRYLVGIDNQAIGDKTVDLRRRQSQLVNRRGQILRDLHAGLGTWSEFHAVCTEIAKIDRRLRSIGRPRKRLPSDMLWVNRTD